MFTPEHPAVESEGGTTGRVGSGGRDQRRDGPRQGEEQMLRGWSWPSQQDIPSPTHSGATPYRPPVQSFGTAELA